MKQRFLLALQAGLRRRRRIYALKSKGFFAFFGFGLQHRLDKIIFFHFNRRIGFGGRGSGHFFGKQIIFGRLRRGRLSDGFGFFGFLTGAGHIFGAHRLSRLSRFAAQRLAVAHEIGFAAQKRIFIGMAELLAHLLAVFVFLIHIVHNHAEDNRGAENQNNQGDIAHICFNL